jgi:hypothetical protein
MKNNQKCVRMSDEVLGYVNGFPGEGFNRKFENLVLYVMKEEGRIKNSIAILEKRELELKRSIADFRSMKVTMDRLKSYMNGIEAMLTERNVDGQMKLDKE